VAFVPLGWVIGFLLAWINVGPGFSVFVQSLVAIAIDGAVGMYVIYTYVLEEDISDFRVVLLPRIAPTIPVAASASPASLTNG